MARPVARLVADRVGHPAVGALGRVFVEFEQADRGEVFVVVEVLEIGDGHTRDRVLTAEGHPLVGREPLGDRVEDPVQVVGIGDPVVGGGEAGIVEQIRALDEGEQIPIVLVRIRQETDPTIGTPAGFPIGRADPEIAERLLLGLEGVAAQMLDEVERRHGFGHRHLDRVAVTRRELPVERPQHGVGDVERDHFVGDRRRHECRLASGPRRHRGEPRHRLDHVVIGGTTGIGAVAAEADGVADHQRRVSLPQCGRAEPEPLECCWPDVRHQCVRRPDDVVQRTPALVGLQIESDRSLVAMQVERDAAHPR